MKSAWFLAASLIAVAPVVCAADKDWQEKCESYSGLAESIMTARQNDVPMSKAMQAAGISGDKDLTELTQTLVIAAYDKPSYSTEEFQQKEINEFRDEVYLTCVKKLRSD